MSKYKGDWSWVSPKKPKFIPVESAEHVQTVESIVNLQIKEYAKDAYGIDGRFFVIRLDPTIPHDIQVKRGPVVEIWIRYHYLSDEFLPAIDRALKMLLKMEEPTIISESGLVLNKDDKTWIKTYVDYEVNPGLFPRMLPESRYATTVESTYIVTDKETGISHRITTKWNDGQSAHSAMSEGRYRVSRDVWLKTVVDPFVNAPCVSIVKYGDYTS